MPVKTFGRSSRGHIQGLSKIFRAPIYRMHHTVIFVVAQLSCFMMLMMMMKVERWEDPRSRWLSGWVDSRWRVTVSSSWCEWLQCDVFMS